MTRLLGDELRRLWKIWVASMFLLLQASGTLTVAAPIGLFASQFDVVRLYSPNEIAEVPLVVEVAAGDGLRFHAISTSSYVVSWIQAPSGTIIEPQTINTVGGSYTQFSGGATLLEPTILPTSTPGYHHWFAMPSLGPGTYRLNFRNDSTVSGEIAVVAELLIDSSVLASLFPNSSMTQLGWPVVLTAIVLENGLPMSNVNVGLTMVAPSGALLNLNLLDDGLAADVNIGDGLYSGYMILNEVGSYSILGAITGTTIAGTPFKRTPATRILVVQPCGTLGNVSDYVEAGGVRLVIEAEVNVTTPGEFILDVALETQSGVSLRAYGSATLPAGAQTIKAYVEADAIRATREDGPYWIKQVELLCVGENGAMPSGRIISDTMQTGAYSWNQFQAGPIELTGDLVITVYDSFPITGRWDTLRVNLGVRVKRTGQGPWSYRFEARLADSCGGTIQTKTGTATFYGNYNPGFDHDDLIINFSGLLIGQHGFSGPYYLDYLYIHGPTDRPSRDTLIKENIGATDPYPIAMFEGASPVADCNQNGQPDPCDIDNEVESDCNLNGVPDSCDTPDCNANGLPDDCESDCNHNGIADGCDITAHSSQDCNLNRIPDECDIEFCFGFAGCADCNNNAIPDGCEPDCNENGVPDQCDITAGTSVDCDANGLPDECPCPACPCPAATTMTPLIPSGTIDAHQPHPLNDNSLAARQGIGSAAEPIVVTLNACGYTRPQCFQFCETGIEEVESGPPLSANQIVSVTQRPAQPGTYDIVLSRPISAKHWTALKYATVPLPIAYACLPGNANGNGITNMQDYTALDNCIRGQTGLCPYGLYSTDLDRSGEFAAVDYVYKFIELRDGAGTYIPWLNKSLPPNLCFTSGGGGGGNCPSEPCDPGGGGGANSMVQGGGGDVGTENLEFSEFQGEITDAALLELDENALLADWFVGFLGNVDPQGAAAQEDLTTIVATMNQWFVNHFSTAEKASLHQRLTDPAMDFESVAGSQAAADAAAAIEPGF